jgi:hypothetical protein
MKVRLVRKKILEKERRCARRVVLRAAAKDMICATAEHTTLKARRKSTLEMGERINGTSTD